MAGLRFSSLIGLVGLTCGLCTVQCTSFPELAHGTCGNGVVDPGEDCDGFPRGDGTACGAAGGAGACRLACSFDPGGSVCPSGWGCGADGICRQPAGSFARRPEAIVAGATRVAIADFDGDHRKDVLTRAQVDARGFSKLRAHYFDAGMALVETTLLPTKVGSPTLRDLDGDGIADVLFTLNAVDATLSGLVNGAVGVFLGQRDRTFEPVAYPTFVFPNTTAKMYPISGFPNSPVRVLVFSKQGSTAAILHPDVSSGAIGIMVNVPDGPDALAGDAVTGNVIESTPCDELVWAYANGTSASVLTTCKLDVTGWVWNDGGAPVTIALPSGQTIDRGVRIFDVNVDGHKDVVIGASGHTFVAYGDGMGGFSAITQPFLVPIYMAVGAAPVMYPMPMPLAIGDLSGDGKPDYITSDLALTSLNGDPNKGYLIAFFRSSGAWTSAAIADFDGNGFPDVVAGSSTDLDLDFLNGTGTVALAPFTIPTTGTTSAFAVGDVDGDLVVDLMLASSTPNAEDRLGIVFGKLGGVPDSPLLVGRFGHIAETATFYPGGAVNSIGVISYSLDPKDTAVRISLLAGSGDRQPLAPFALVAGATQGVPINVVAGAFAKDPNVDFVALAGDIPTTPRAPLSLSPFRTWIAPATGPAIFQTSTPTTPLDGALHPYGGTSSAIGAAALMASGDVDGDGVPEVVAVMPYTKDDTTSAIVVSRPTPDGKGGWTVANGAPIQLDFPVSLLEGAIALADVDGDGRSDLVLIGGTGATRKLVVLWNSGNGGFSQTSSTTVNVAGEAPTDFAFVRVAAAELPAIVYVTHTSVIVAALATDRQTITRTTIDSTLNYGTGVAGGDIDGDGVDDIAVADTPSLVLYRGQPALK